ncbi:MAG: hypothetical protein ACHQWV_03915 [Nitrospirales bacterium]
MEIQFLIRITLLVIVVNGGLVGPAFAEGPCMDRVYSRGEKTGPDYAFDLAFDKDKAGRSFSCGPEMRAWEARRAIESFRNGVLYRDRARMDSVLSYPLTARITKTLEVDEKPEVITIRDFREWSKFQEERMGKNQIAMVACANLGNVSIETGRSPGFMIGKGLVWFSRYVGSPRVKVSSINLFPVDTEAVVKACIP